MNTGKENLLEEVGRLDSRRNPNSNERAEKRRVIRELDSGYKKGGRVKGVGCAKRGYGKALKS
jgi:soluble P-type ATPase